MRLADFYYPNICIRADRREIIVKRCFLTVIHVLSAVNPVACDDARCCGIAGWLVVLTNDVFTGSLCETQVLAFGKILT